MGPLRAPLEAFQARCLRRILRSPAHNEKENNPTIRQRAQVYSIASHQRWRRLVWWRMVLSDTGCNLVAVRAVMFGVMGWGDEAGPTCKASARLALLAADLEALRGVVDGGGGFDDGG